ncbi:MAG: hypothetical protein LBI28_14975 [Treponema sp.]|jgi:hypothetical protein|nr:hypothetical protein [Treponema sp.]
MKTQRASGVLTLFFLLCTISFSYNLFADEYQVSFHNELVAEFPPLSNDEKLAYFAYNVGTVTFYAVNDKTWTRREIKRFDDVFQRREIQFANNRTNCFFQINTHNGNWEYPVYYIDGRIGQIRYIIDTYYRFTTTENGRYMVFTTRNFSYGKILTGVLIDLNVQRKIMDITWEVEKSGNGDFLFLRNGTDKFTIYNDAEYGRIGAVAAFDPGNRVLHVLWDRTNEYYIYPSELPTEAEYRDDIFYQNSDPNIRLNLDEGRYRIVPYQPPARDGG